MEPQELKIVAIILTYNEEKHIERCLNALKDIASECIIIDCYSNDRTVEIATNLGAKVYQRKWVNYSDQFKWGMAQVPADCDWVMRIDADEYVSDEFREDIKNRLQSLGDDIAGVYCGLRRFFQGRMIRFGAVNITMLRLWRNAKGAMETRWMDEHIKLSGKAIYFRGYIIDHNLNPLSWWVEKHNGYSAREVIDILNKEYNFIQPDSAKHNTESPFGIKRWLKENVYYKLPSGIRAFMYFCFRYFFALGFLDGAAGFSFHFLQGFWYRYLVDAKLAEVKRIMAERKLDVKQAIYIVLNVRV